MTEQRRVVVTGIGVVSPLGLGREAFWKGALEGTPIFEGRSARAAVPDFNAARLIQKKGTRYLGRGSRHLAAASVLALEDSGYDGGEDLGCVVGTAFGNNSETFNFTHLFLTQGVEDVLPMASFDSALNSQTNYTSLVVGAQRFIKTICGMTASLEAVAEGAAMIRAGRARAVLAGGMDYLNVDLERWLALDWKDPERPVSEGAYVLILEDGEAAARRGAAVLAEVRGAGVGFDSGREPEVLGRRVVAEALEAAAADLVVCSRGGEAVEAANAARLVISDLAGDCLGASGALGAIIGVLSLHAGALPARAESGTDHLDLGRALVLDFEAGGNFVALSLSRPGEIPS